MYASHHRNKLNYIEEMMNISINNIVKISISIVNVIYMDVSNNARIRIRRCVTISTSLKKMLAYVLTVSKVM